MKKIVYTISALAILALSACDVDDPTYNDNKTKPYNVPAESLVANAQRELADQSTTPEVNLNPFRFYTQYWAATQYPAESRYNITSRSIANNLWNNFFRDVLGNLETAKVIITENEELDEATKQNQHAIIEIIEVYTFQLLIDTFGDVPYSEALDPLNVLPIYDNDSQIYPLLITRLDAALADLDEAEGTFTSGDILLGGDVARWRQFGNTLKVKLGINLADVDGTLARNTIESAVQSGDLILTNADNVVFNYSGNAPFYNPIHAQLVASNRNDFVASATIVDAMNSLDDPRRSVYFEQLGGEYIGGINGAANNYFNFSPVGETLKANNFPAVIFEATEINFYLAEAAARGYSVGGTAEEYYNEGIRASFDYWGATGVDTYLADPDVAYATAAGSYKQKIGTQAWLAFYNRPFESWNSWRRLDYPQLTPAQSAVTVSNGEIPVRFTYPINEQTVNNANWTSASEAIGGDFLYTPVFWDVTQP